MEYVVYLIMAYPYLLGSLFVCLVLAVIADAFD